MKKILLYFLSIAFCTLVIASCKKPTKGKIVNEWSVRLYRETNSSGTYTLFDAPDSPNKLKIKKDGTWVWTRETNFNGVIFGGSVHVSGKEIYTNEGTWCLAKTDGDKDKRLILNTLSETEYKKTIYSPNISGLFEDSEGTTTKTYAEGEKTMKYSILESTNKTLKLEAEGPKFNPADSTTILTKFELNLAED